jgi:hypothetical protein
VLRNIYLDSVSVVLFIEKQWTKYKEIFLDVTSEQHSVPAMTPPFMPVALNKKVSEM